jgi:uncharacterized protein
VPAWIRSEDAAGVTIAVQVIPRARQNVVVGPQGDALKVRLAAPPVEGAANEALIAYLAELLGVRRREVSLVSGAQARRKLVRIQGLQAGEVTERLVGG